MRTRTIAIDQGAPGTTELVVGRSPREIVVTSYLVVSDGGGTIQFKSGTTAKSGAIPCGDKGGIAFPGDEDSVAIRCEPGESLNLVSTGGPAKGHLTYKVEA